jgi:hypothetical protein
MPPCLDRWERESRRASSREKARSQNWGTAPLGGGADLHSGGADGAVLEDAERASVGAPPHHVGVALGSADAENGIGAAIGRGVVRRWSSVWTT